MFLSEVAAQESFLALQILDQDTTFECLNERAGRRDRMEREGDDTAGHRRSCGSDDSCMRGGAAPADRGRAEFIQRRVVWGGGRPPMESTVPDGDGT